ncbi:MAG: T9SS type A sorting domain-containing protein [Candidatus Marinimicrobia bacterium]|nr:T9SS type A sorting domain-containing protein [Candidatus Neomarinimicrobiota bacterium]MCF7905310.1 T9SS type A sorting domain-containing protein [Candidatus Neomarinimicrobiota bacterium]
MSGYLRDGSPFINSATGEATKFVHPDDPNLNIDGTDNIWVDGDDNPADDRRFLMNVGPFDFAAGDSAEVVFGILHAQGTSALGSVSLLKYNDQYAQAAYDANFDLPDAPPVPELSVSTAAGEIILEWEDNAEDYSAFVAGNNSYYNFEGYNIYQYETGIGVGEKTIVATYDLKNGITTIKDDVFSTEYGDVVTLPIQSGTDSGIKRYISIKSDVLRGGIPLIDDRNYYFSVTAYGYNGFSAPKLLESSSPILAVRPQTNVTEAPTASTGAADYTVSHTGTADASVDLIVADPYDLTGDDYEIYFDQQHYYVDLDGLWKTTNYADSVGKAALGLAKDLTGTTLTGIAYTSPTAGTRDLKFILDISASPDYDWCDGLELTFPAGITINSAEVATGSGDGHAWTPTIAGQVVTWGSMDTTTAGSFAGGEVFTVNVQTPTLPLSVDFLAFDDGWAVDYGAPYDTLGAGIVHGTGTAVITEEGYAFKTIKHWNLKNGDGDVLIEDQTTVNGYQSEYIMNGALYSGGGNVGLTTLPIVDGFQVNLVGSYDAPLTYADVQLNGSSLSGGGAGNQWTDDNFRFTDFMYFGYDDGTAASSLGAYSSGTGTSSIDLLQKDYELRWTGVLADTVIAGDTLEFTQSGGQMVTIFGASGYDLADHPMNPSPGTEAAFLLRVPFEVWNLDDGQQVNVLYWDRSGDPTANGGKTWNTDNRQYAWCVSNAYDDSAPLDPGSAAVAENATWNWVFYQSTFTTGDVITFKYANPLQLGVDSFEFTTTAPTALATDLDMIKAWPNPYFGYNPEERTPLQNSIHFINLPETATINIYSLAGQLVRTIEHSGGQEAIWDAQNSFNVLVASGVYIAVVSTDEGDKALKLAVVMPAQRLDVY